MSERKVISKGIAWFRYVVGAIIFFIVLTIPNSIKEVPLKLLSILILVLIFYALKKARKLQYDVNNFYIIHGEKEKIITYKNIISIKRSRTKVNGGRFWIVLYKNEDGYEKKCRFFLDFFYSDFLNSVKAKNPSVVIWTHPFFNH